MRLDVHTCWISPLLVLLLAGATLAEPTAESPATDAAEAKVATDAQAEGPTDQAAAGESPATVEAVVEQIVAEARDYWQEHESWVRTEATYADDHAIDLPREKVIEALGEELAPNPILDGYVKLQLLSFVDRFDYDQADQVRPMLAAMPAVVNQPQPSTGQQRQAAGGGGPSLFIGNQVPYVRDVTPIIIDGKVYYKPEISVLSDGIVLDASGVVTADRRHVMMTVRTASSQLVALRRFALRANAPILEFREEVAGRLPDGPERVALLVQDVSDRLHAGDPTYTNAMQRLIDETDRLRRSRDLPLRVRRMLVRQMQHLARFNKSFIREIEIKGDRQYQVHRDQVRLDPQRVEHVIANLEGRDPDK